MLSNGWWFHAHWNLICISFAYISMNPAAGSSCEIALYRSRLMPWFAYANEPFKRNCDGNFLKIVLAVSWIYFGDVNWINFLFVTGGADRKWRRTQSHTGSHQSNAIAQSSLRSQKVIHPLKRFLKKILKIFLKKFNFKISTLINVRESNLHIQQTCRVCV